jgi:2-dehydro-3-deoxyphosphogluconate aldolase/(4S)-4-hydroxy-2-oxoglutarate aldolase
MAILRAKSADRFVEVAKTLVDSGVKCLEVTLTSGGALEAIGELRAALPDDINIGAGTVITSDAARSAIESGAEFLVSPSCEIDVIAVAAEAGVGSYPGAFTATEILIAWRAGASAVKLFPASAVGPSYVKNLAGPFPDIPILPTGGIELDQIGAWIRAGVVGVGLGGPLLGDAAGSGDLEALAERARHALSEAKAALPGRQGELA